MAPIRGRPVQTNYQILNSVILKYKHEIVRDDNSIISKSDNIWKIISTETGKSPAALYTYATCREQIKRLLLNVTDSDVDNCDRSENLSHDDSIRAVNVNNDQARRETFDSSLDISNVSNSSEIKVDIYLSKKELEDLIEYKLYKRSEKQRRYIPYRRYPVMKNGEWQLLITEKLWAATRRKCGYHFSTHKIYPQSNSGTFSGYCNCGSTVKGNFENLKTEVIKVTCILTKGDGRCGKRYLRKPERGQVATELNDKNVCPNVYRIQKASEIMQSGDKFEPPHLYAASVLKTAKAEHAALQHAHRDPATSLAIHQKGQLKHAIHSSGRDPFYVHYWTNNQIHVYRTHCKQEDSCIAIDATGSIVRKVVKVDGSKSQHIFLYQCVMRSEAGQFSVAQMLSEVHNTNAIQYWLMEWVRTGAPQPKEVVCDDSKALLTAAIKQFTPHKTINDYASACTELHVPKCYIRIDVAHCIKSHANFLKNESKGVKKFYLACLGQLILVRTTNDAKKLLESILIVCCAKHEGNMRNGQETACAKHKRKLEELLTGNYNPEDNEDDSMCNEDIPNDGRLDGPSLNDSALGDISDQESELRDGCDANLWHQMVNDIHKNVQSLVNDEKGNRYNTHYLPRLADRILKNSKTLPLWTCVCRDTFKYGRVAASSAPVESDFNDLKNRLLANRKLPMRVDDFVETHINYIEGKMKIIDALLQTPQTEIPLCHMDHTVPIEPLSLAMTEQNDQSPITETHKKLTVTDKNDHTRFTAELYCPVCADGNMPGGGHRCAICDKAVHLMSGCSVPLEGEEEGYGQKRICLSCAKMKSSDIENIISSQEVENWKGLADPSKKKSRYMQTDFLNNEFVVHERISKVPILKNGHSMMLKPVAVGKEFISLTNTCAFDSLFQIMLCATYDRPLMRQYMEETSKASNDLFLKMILDVSRNGIGSHAYRQRVIILKEKFTSTKRPNNCLLVDCKVTASTMCKYVLKNSPSYEEVSICNRGCPPRRKELQVIPLERKSLTISKLDEAVQENVLLEGERMCCNKDCTGMETTSVSGIGKIVLLEVYESFDDVGDNSLVDDIPIDNLRLDEIPKKLQLPFSNEEYNLVGIVNFHPPAVQRRYSECEIGHYTGISCRRNGSWVMYDDCKESGKRLQGNYRATPQIIVYTI